MPPARARFELDPATGTTRELPVPGMVTVNNSESYRAACLAGLGIIQVPEVGVRTDLNESRLVEVLPAHRAAPMPVTLLFPDRRRLPARVRVFMERAGSVLAPVLMERPE